MRDENVLKSSPELYVAIELMEMHGNVTASDGGVELD
jgi:hypothetical protein